MKKGSFFFIFLLLCYVSVLIPLTHHLQARPFVEKLGYVPSADVLKLGSADQRQLLGASLVMKVLMYFGSLVEESAVQDVYLPPDFEGIKRLIRGAVTLDPYNIDTYYFAQAILVWDVGQIEEANALLEEGMRYRDWDFYLPFFAGFNYAYFLKDYENAARYYKRAGELSGSELYVKLAGRYFYEAGQTELAIAFLSTMAKSANNEAIKKTYDLRLEALKKVRSLEVARDAFRSKFNRLPVDIAELTDHGFIDQAPIDPYGGRFFIDEQGGIGTTSKFASQ